MDNNYKTSKQKYYELICKGGHVGRNKYYEIHFFIIATSKKEASQSCKKAPRVKKHHKDYILKCTEISLDEYQEGNEELKNQPYYTFKTKSEQKEYIEMESRNNPEKFHECYEKYIKDETRILKYSKKNRQFKKKKKYDHLYKKKNFDMNEIFSY